jgi:hypothetical protein
VNSNCDGKIELLTGQTSSGITLSEVVVDSGNYYKASGITGTGGAESSNSKLEIWDSTDVLAGSNVIFELDDMTFYANYTNMTDGEPINAVGSACFVQFNISESWTSLYSMTYIPASEIYEYVRYFDNKSGLFGFNVTCNISTGVFDELNSTDSFVVNHSKWDVVQGNTTGDLAIGNTSVFEWDVTDYYGNIYAADADSVIMWNSLYAIGKNTSQAVTSNDFNDLDVSLNLQSGNNVSTFWIRGGQPVNYTNITIFSKHILDVPVTNSTNNTAFYTGIMWDSSDDIDDGEYDSTDKEDLVFVANINNETIGKYTLTDFEIKIPQTLETYKAGSDLVALYLEIR